MHEVRPDKAAKVAEIKEMIDGAQAVVLVNYCGLTVAEDTKLRRSMREAGVKYVVVKNTLLRIAAKECGVDGLDAYLEKNTAIAVGKEDPVAAAKILVDFAKEHKALEIKGGILTGNVIDVAGVKALADLPPKEVLLAKMLGSMQAPISGFARVLQGTIAKVVYALDAVRKAKESA